MTLDWEFFIRIAFGFKHNKGRAIQRGGDPACLASNDLFNDRHFHDMVIATGYAFEILNQDVKNRTVAVSEETLVMLDSYIVQILDAHTIKDIEDILNSYKASVLNKFFKYDGNVLTRK
ncbi:MAG: hypothetical protein A2X61_11095 [Ignavibacteria bacterium GWB2_35_12]|nr:MAG: hypothetical protein A2X61_11095 [Ignavibacteria bacterium GWB2_35_12]OGU87648.1 MAG: hypothetical protein A2220_12640 [Ignavibacteria bacterium RIFOXYA2_FULL_35_10]OGV24781.1 MAG: hypothetical protein A2475_14320 [Ignavibacteria bacterium RIFOXYC2_FULL_35_21]